MAAIIVYIALALIALCLIGIWNNYRWEEKQREQRHAREVQAICEALEAQAKQVLHQIKHPPITVTKR